MFHPLSSFFARIYRPSVVSRSLVRAIAATALVTTTAVLPVSAESPLPRSPSPEGAVSSSRSRATNRPCSGAAGTGGSRKLLLSRRSVNRTSWTSLSL